MHGLSLIELTIIFAILFAIAALGIAGYSNLGVQGSLEKLTQDIKSTLENARSKSIASENLMPWGVHFESDRFVLFRTLNYDPAATTNTVLVVDRNLQIGTTSLANSTSNVVFMRPFGTTNNFGTVVVRSNISNDERVIRVDQSGVVSIDTAAPSAVDNPNSDTRHVHFNLAVAVTNYTTLDLVFDDSPDPDVVDTINVGDCLDQSATFFDCDREVDVGGQIQHIRIYSHFLDSLSTVLGVNRDRRENTKAVEIWFDYPGGLLVASYDASGNVTKGPSGLVGSPEIQ